MNPPAEIVPYRYTDRPFPSYRFVPGKAPHPTRHQNGHSYNKPPVQLGPSVGPGRYSVQVSVGEASDTVTITLAKDPRSFATDAQIEDWAATLGEMKVTIDEVLQTLDRSRKARARIRELMAGDESAELQELGNAAIGGIDAWEKQINQLKHETYEDEDAWATMLDGQLGFLMDVIDTSGAPVTDGARTRLNDLMAQWTGRQNELQGITDRYIEPINQWANQHQVGHIIIPLESN